MKFKFPLIVGALLLAATSAEASPGVPPVAPILDEGAVQQVQYYGPRRYDRRGPRYWRRGGYQPPIWRYQRRFPSRGRRDFYGSPSFHGS